MIDMHESILPGLDGGTPSLDHSLAIAEAAVKNGIDTIIAVPRYKNGEYSNTRVKIEHQTAVLNERLQNRNLPLMVLPGQQAKLHAGMLDSKNIDNLLPAAGNSEYLIVELPHQLPSNLGPLSYNLQLQRLIPIFAQPELHPFMQEHPTELYQQVKNGVFVQISAASVLGKHGGKVKKFVNQLIEANLVHFVASGVHNTKKEAFYLKEAYNQIEKTHGLQTMTMLQRNSEDLINQKLIVGLEPQRIQQKKLLGFL